MKKNKKILIVSECFLPEEFKINDVALSWVKEGYSVDVLTLTPTYPQGKVFPGYKNKFFYKEKLHGMNVYRVRGVTGYRENFVKKVLRFLNFMCLGSFAAVLIGRKYDYIFGFNAGALTSMLPAVVTSKIYKKPLMFWVQDVWPDSLFAYGVHRNRFTSYFLDKFVAFMHRSLSSIAVSGRGFEKKLRPYVKKDIKFHYLPNWADDLDMSARAAALGSMNLTQFTFAGNIGKQQNLENIIQAFSSMPKKYQEQSQLNIIGDGGNLDYLRLSGKDNSQVLFHGRKKRENMAQFYKASDFLIISLVDDPIFSVTVPAKTQTYIAAKKPILAIINGDTADLVKQYKLGLCAHPSDIDGIAKLFQECIDMEANCREDYIKNNERLLNTIFKKEKIIDDLLTVLEGKDGDMISQKLG